MKLLLEIPEVLKANFEHGSFKSLLDNKDIAKQETAVGYPHMSAEEAREIDGTVTYPDKEAEYMTLAHQMLMKAFEDAIIVEEDKDIQTDPNDKENSIYLKELDCENYKILTFSLNGHTYTLNPNLKENRDLVKQEINSHNQIGDNMALMRSDVLFKVYGAKCVSSQKVTLRPEEHHYEGADGKEYIKYSCQLCEALAKSYPNKLMDEDKQFRDFSFSQGTKQCPCCGINIDWSYKKGI